MVAKELWHNCGVDTLEFSSLEVARGELGTVDKRGAARAETEILRPPCLDGPGVPGAAKGMAMLLPRPGVPGTAKGMAMLLPRRRRDGPGVPAKVEEAQGLIARLRDAHAQVGQVQL